MLVWYGNPQLNSYTKGNKLKVKCKNTIPIRIPPTTYFQIIGICKLFLCISKPIHALLDSN